MSPLPEDWNDGDRPGWDDKLADILGDMFGGKTERIWNDSFVLDLFHDGWVNPDISTLNRNRAREALDFTVYEDYDIVFEDEFDFEAFFDWLYGG